MRKHNYEYYSRDYTNIENYELALADNFKGWHCHHRLETHNSDGERRSVDLTRAELIALDMYYNRPAEELIFMKNGEHMILHHQKYEYDDKRQFYSKYMVAWHRKHIEKYTAYQKDYHSRYDNQICNYNGEIVKLNTLKARFRKAGYEHPTAEAKKYLTSKNS